MTSPNEPPKESLRSRVSSNLSTDSRGKAIDADERFTRNVSWLFYALIVVAVIIIVGGLIYGFYEANIKPVASVDGSDVSRGEWEDRYQLEEFRADRADSVISTAIADGTIDADLANRRFSTVLQERPATKAEAMTGLVDLLFAKQLADEAGVQLDEGELQESVVADGTFPEARLVELLVVLTTEQAVEAAATDAGIADARERANTILTELEAGADPEELAETYGPATYQRGVITEGDINDSALTAEISALDAGDTSSVIEAPTGEQLIAIVEAIYPAEADPGFVEAVNDEVGEDIHLRNVELEATAAKLEEHITSEALAAEYDQLKLAEIFIERSSNSTDDTAGEARVSHILYQPETPLDEDGNPTEVADLAADDPAWADAQLEAERAAGQLAEVEDIDSRMDAFAQRAQLDSDGPTAPQGGDLGYFPEGFMVPEFNDAIWESMDAQHGDIIGPVRTQFGWHVILFDEFRSSLDVRVAQVQEALAAEGADFATVAAEHSDGPEAAAGGEIGWQLVDELDDLTLLALSAVEVGEMTEPDDEGYGIRIYLKQDQATRPLEPADAAVVGETAYVEWFDERYSAAEDEGRISIDDSVYEQ